MKALLAENGIPLLVESDDFLPIVDVVIGLPLGSAWDPPGLEGLTALSVHMLRRGTSAYKPPKGPPLPALSSQEFEASIERLGASIEVELQRTSVRIHASVIRPNLAPLFSLLGAMLEAPALVAQEFLRLRNQTMAHLESELDDDAFLGTLAWQKHLFQDHPFARPSYGTLSSLAQMRVDQVRAFFEEWIKASPIIVGFGGAISPEEAVELIEANFGVRKSKNRPFVLSEPPPPKGIQVAIVHQAQREQSQLFVTALGAKLGAPSFYPLVVANAAFGGMYTSRLVRHVRELKGWSYSAMSHLYADRVRDAWVIHTHPPLSVLGKCMKLELDLIQEFWRDGIKEDELDGAKRHLIHSHAFRRESAFQRLSPYLEAWLHELPGDALSQPSEEIARLTPQDVNQAIQSAWAFGHDFCVVISMSGPAPQLEKEAPRLSGALTIYEPRTLIR
ncbi:MAG: pitrilysin family protein [Sandaracinaceae bacterium]|nr:pitrilysin family protein [Sandaracinaceae bacterium]